MTRDTDTTPQPHLNPSPGTVTVIGSGELATAMSRVHRAVMSGVDGPVQAVFVDTPAGFQLNADHISTKAVDYFQQHFDLTLAVASFKSAATITPIQVENALRKLRLANYIFAGPGSPTYAVRHWQNTPIWEAITCRLASGAHLAFASAAAIAVGRYALPVYEVYKVGEEPRWVDGLNLLGPYGFELAIVPHWNNTEGGTHDTRYCFMGEPRLKHLEDYLPDSAIILGVDEYTACAIDLSAHEGRVMGAGQVTIRHKGCEIYYPSGTAFPLDQFKSAAHILTDETTRSTHTQDIPIQARDISEAVEAMLRQLPTTWEDWPDVPEEDAVGIEPLIDLIVWVRSQLRAARQWALSDEIRDRLLALGVTLKDGPAETVWNKE